MPATTLFTTLTRLLKLLKHGQALLSGSFCLCRRLYCVLFWLANRTPAGSSSLAAGRTAESRQPGDVLDMVSTTSTETAGEIEGLDDKGMMDAPEVKPSLNPVTVVESLGSESLTASLSCIPGFFPTAPQLFQRYRRGELMEKQRTQYTIPPGVLQNTRTSPPGWTACVHPEGALYYFHEDKRIFTDARLHRDSIFSILTSFLARSDRLKLPSECDLVLDLIPSNRERPQDSEGYTCGYYFIDHHKKTVFWDCPFDIKRLYRTQKLYALKSAAHIQFELTAQYWQHCELFPTALTLTHAHILSLRDVLTHQMGDALTSPTTTVPFSVEYLGNMLTMVNNMTDCVGGETAGSMCILARFMWIFEAEKFFNFSGEPGVRLSSTKSVYTGSHKKSWLIKTVAPLLFNIPLTHLRAFEQIFLDELLRRAPWDRRIEALIVQWQELILFATVLMNADMAFLAIPIVDNGDRSQARSVGQIAAYISVIASFGSVLVGLVLSRLNRDRRDASLYAAATYLRTHYHARFGFETLSILYSLPFALLLWGAFAFLVAFLDMCFQASDLLTRALVSSVAFLTALGIFWCFDQEEDCSYCNMRFSTGIHLLLRPLGYFPASWIVYSERFVRAIHSESLSLVSRVSLKCGSPVSHIRASKTTTQQ
ncbi:hypothetical protein C8F01DRAFT_1243009 [Mycena amicta]|nr:hypothetical protein C8F01DRAFT_1243009 [Mycena amicta]